MICYGWLHKVDCMQSAAAAGNDGHRMKEVKYEKTDLIVCHVRDHVAELDTHERTGFG